MRDCDVVLPFDVIDLMICCSCRSLKDVLVLS